MRMTNTYTVYISCVGEQDPVSEKTQVEGALLTCFRYLKAKNVQFQAAYLIPTSRETSPQRQTEDRAEDCKVQLETIERNLNVELKPLRVQNPADLRQVYPKIRELLEDIIQDANQKAQGNSLILHMNVSSGTPQMKESLPFLVSTGQLGTYQIHLWQVFDPRGGATQLQERVQAAPQMDLLTQERLLLRMEQLANQLLFQETNGLLQSTLQTKHLQFARQLYQILANHDRWEYKQAYNQLSKLLRNSDQVPDFLRSWLSKLLGWLQILQEKDVPLKDKLALAIDRYYCGCRRLENSLYPDALSHFWTTCELMLEEHGAQIGLPRQKQESAYAYIRRTKEERTGSVLVQTRVNGRSLIDKVDWLRRIRNEVEHGTRPVNEKLAKDAQAIAKTVLQALGKKEEMEECPVRPELVQKKLLRLITEMRGSLWA